MRERALEVLAEPGTGAALDLEVRERAGDVVLEGRLVSQASGRGYPIVGGVPRFGRSTVEPPHLQTMRFEALTGLDRAALDGRWCFDAGCGDGRWAGAAASLGAKVLAMTGADAVEALSRAHPEVDFVQGDLLDPPVRPGTFDVAYAIDVVQGFDDPARAAHLAVTAAKDDGTFCLTVPADPRFAAVAEPLAKLPGLRHLARQAMAMTWREVDLVLRATGAKSWRFSSKAPVIVSGTR